MVRTNEDYYVSDLQYQIQKLKYTNFPKDAMIAVLNDTVSKFPFVGQKYIERFTSAGIMPVAVVVGYADSDAVIIVKKTIYIDILLEELKRVTNKDNLLKAITVGASWVLDMAGAAKEIENSSDSEVIDGVKDLGKSAIDIVGDMSNSDDVKTFGEFTKCTLDVVFEVAKSGINEDG